MKQGVKQLTIQLAVWALAAQVMAQSSSLYVVEAAPEPIPPTRVRGVTPLRPSLVQASYAAVLVPEPRIYELYDLVTIIVRESTVADSESTLDLQKDVGIDANVSAFPDIRVLNKLVDLVSAQNLSENPTVSVDAGSEFRGEGEYERRDTFTSRITARIIDIKPNGTMVLEARRFIKNDKETLDMVLTGTCRQEDIAADNTILSTQLYDLRLVKEHKGELRKATKKGWLTKILETVINF